MRSAIHKSPLSLRSSRGASMLEYALLVLLISLATTASLAELGSRTSEIIACASAGMSPGGTCETSVITDEEPP